MIVALLLVLGQAASPFPAGDGFVYPGQPGSEGIRTYLHHWDAFVARMPPRGENRLAEAGWMPGQWSVTFRDFGAEPPAIETGATGTASIRMTPDGRWLDIAIDAGPWSRHQFIGYDTLARRWTMQTVMAPGVAYTADMHATGWHDDRLRFSGAVMDYHGLKTTDRVTLVHDSDRHFRIVTETRIGKHFVAVDDIVFDRQP